MTIEEKRARQRIYNARYKNKLKSMPKHWQAFKEKKYASYKIYIKANPDKRRQYNKTYSIKRKFLKLNKGV